MTTTAKIWASVIVAMLAAVIALLIVLVVQGSEAEWERQMNACNDKYAPTSDAYWQCVEDAG